MKVRITRLAIVAAATSLFAGLLPAIAGIGVSPAAAVGSYNNATIADTALRYVGQFGGAAGVTAGRSGYTGGSPLGSGDNMDGECRAFVNEVVWIASNHTQWMGGGNGDYFARLAALGTQITSINALQKGDVVQRYDSPTSLHTFIIVSRASGSTFNVVDSNYVAHHRVGSHQITVALASDERAFRLGTTAQAPQPTPPSQPAPVVPANYHAGRQVSIDRHATGGDSGHTGPSNSYAAGPTRPVNSALWIVCYVNGQSISGPYGTETIWDLADDGYYYADAWVYTGTNGPAVQACAFRNATVDRHATGGVSGHTGPSNSSAAGPTRAVNSGITLACYVDGQSIAGPYGTETIWDLATDGLYYADAWIYTGTNGAAVPHC